MTQTNIHRVLAILIAVCLACAIAGAPLAVVAADGSGDGLSGAIGSDDDPADDGGADDGEDDADGTDDSEESTDDDENVQSTDDDGADESADDEDSDSSVSESVEQTVENTLETAGETVELADETVSDTSNQAVGIAGSATGIGDGDEPSLDPLFPFDDLNQEIDSVDPVSGQTSFDLERTGERPEANQHPNSEDAPSDRDTYDEVAMAASGSGGGQPIPTAPIGGALVGVGVGALAAAAALRGTPILASNGVPLLNSVSTAPVWSVLDRIPPVLLPLRYSRYDDSDPLEHEAREEVYEVVNGAPGSYLSEVSEEADLPLSTTRHHIKVLEREGLVSGAKLRGKRRFYPAYAEGIELAAALNDDSTASIIDAINRLGAASVSDLATKLERDPSTISHHLQRLEEDGIIAREREGRAVMNKLSGEARTALAPETTPKPGQPKEAMAGGAD